jgi:hypothetical protein
MHHAKYAQSFQQKKTSSATNAQEADHKNQNAD